MALVVKRTPKESQWYPRLGMWKYGSSMTRTKMISPLNRRTLRPTFLGRGRQLLSFQGMRRSSVERTQARTAPSSSARVKQVMDVDSKKVHGMRNFRDAMLKSSAEKSNIDDLPYKDIGARSSSSAEKQRVIDLSHKNSGCLYQSKEEDRTEKAASLLSRKAKPSHDGDMCSPDLLNISARKVVVASKLQRRGDCLDVATSWKLGAVAAILLLVRLLPTMVVWKASVE
ncbi:unnamed protein product [Prunus brigantina]